jgi:hypothetical protein
MVAYSKQVGYHAHKQCKPTWLLWLPLLSTVNNFVDMLTLVHKNPNPLPSKAHLTTLNLSNFKIIEAMGLKFYCIEVTLNGIFFLPNFTKMYQAVHKLLVGGGGDRQTT